MKKLLISLVLILTATCLYAAENSQPILVPDNTSGVTNSVTSAHKFWGSLESIFIDISGTSTQTVTIATDTLTLFTATDVTADVLYSPVYPVHDSTGTTVGSLTNQNTKAILVNEAITVTVEASSVTTNDTTVLIKTRSTGG